METARGRGVRDAADAGAEDGRIVWVRERKIIDYPIIFVCGVVGLVVAHGVVSCVNALAQKWMEGRLGPMIRRELAVATGEAVGEV